MPDYVRPNTWADAESYGRGLANSLSGAFMQLPQQKMQFAQQLAAMQAQQTYRQQQAQQQAVYQQGVLNNQNISHGLQRDRLAADQAHWKSQNTIAQAAVDERSRAAREAEDFRRAKSQEPHFLNGNVYLPSVAHQARMQEVYANDPNIMKQPASSLVSPFFQEAMPEQNAMTPVTPPQFNQSISMEQPPMQNALEASVPQSPAPVPQPRQAQQAPVQNGLIPGMFPLMTKTGVDHSIPTGNALLQHMDRNLRNYLGIQMMTNKPASLLPTEMGLSNAVFHNKGPFANVPLFAPQNSGVTHYFDGTNLVPVQ